MDFKLVLCTSSKFNYALPCSMVLISFIAENWDLISFFSLSLSFLHRQWLSMMAVYVHNLIKINISSSEMHSGVVGGSISSLLISSVSLARSLSLFTYINALIIQLIRFQYRLNWQYAIVVIWYTFMGAWMCVMTRIMLVIFD